MILVMRPKSLIFAIKNRHLKLSFDVVYGKQMTHHVHDGYFEIRPNEPKLMIGVHFLEKKRKNKRKITFFRQLVKFFFQESCKISCKICIQLKNLARFEFRSLILQDSHQKQEIGKNLQRFAFNFRVK